MSIENYGRYQLLKRIATGGMAEIHLARRAAGPRDALLVVKRILPHLAGNGEFVQMFLDEARIAARLNHPNIAQLSDLGAQGGTSFIAMEYIQGEDVRRIWKRAATPPAVRPASVPKPVAGSRPAAQTGIVRFLVTPWGEVRCDGVLLGRTPFGERELRAGTYACEVSHPQLGTARRRVAVKANAVEKVLVQFKE